jgi:high-affinity K+ transport system ATPase subunit B
VTEFLIYMGIGFLPAVATFFAFTSYGGLELDEIEDVMMLGMVVVCAWFFWPLVVMGGLVISVGVGLKRVTKSLSSKAVKK